MMVFLSLPENHPILNGLVQRVPINSAGNFRKRISIERIGSRERLLKIGKTVAIGIATRRQTARAVKLFPHIAHAVRVQINHLRWRAVADEENQNCDSRARKQDSETVQNSSERKIPATADNGTGIHLGKYGTDFTVVLTSVKVK